MIFEHSSYRTYLRSSLADSISRNPKFSLRAFAKKLSVSPSTLSELMSGKKNLSREKARVLSRALSLKTRESDYFCLLAEIEATDDQQTKSDLWSKAQTLSQRSRLRPSHNLQIDAFKAIADWYHFPILELTQLPKFKFESRAVADKLGITPFEAQSGIDRLVRLELLEVDSKGRGSKVQNRVLAASPGRNQALRDFHSQMLSKAQTSLLNQAPEERFIGSETFAFDSKQVRQADEIAEEFFNRMQDLANQTKSPDHIYHLGVQFFRVTRKEK